MKVESKICELCSRPFMRQVPICRALAENDCPECRKIVEDTREMNPKRVNRVLAERAHTYSFWQSERPAVRLSF